MWFDRNLNVIMPSDRRSICWVFMKALSQKEVKCNLCGNVLKYINGSTSSLNRHLTSKHLFDLEAEKIKASIKETAAPSL